MPREGKYMSNFNDLYDHVAADRTRAIQLLGIQDIRRKAIAELLAANAYTELMNIQSGKILGIGVELGIDQTGYAKVTRVYDGSPAQEAGIAVGDYITTVGDTDIKSLSGADAVYKALQGEAGTTVTVTWLDSAASSHTADLTHSGYTSTTVDYQLLDNVGYIRIRQFDGTTPSELDYALRTLTANGAASLVFDLRDNGGGILEDAVNCIDLIAPEGTVAYAEDKNGNRTVIGSSDAESAVSLPMVCLVNGQRGGAVCIQPAYPKRGPAGGHHHHGQGHDSKQSAAPVGRQCRGHHGGKAGLRRRQLL